MEKVHQWWGNVSPPHKAVCKRGINIVYMICKKVAQKSFSGRCGKQFSLALHTCRFNNLVSSSSSLLPEAIGCLAIKARVQTDCHRTMFLPPTPCFFILRLCLRVSLLVWWSLSTYWTDLPKENNYKLDKIQKNDPKALENEQKSRQTLETGQNLKEGNGTRWVPIFMASRLTENCSWKNQRKPQNQSNYSC